jgi:transcriptional regulator with XRE-family HTH domain
MLFKDKLRELMDAAGLSEAKLAKVSGLNPASVHNYTNQRRTPSFPAIVELARALNVDCTAFAGCDMRPIEGKGKPAAPKRKPRKPA